MKKNEYYRFCLKSGLFDETPVFKINVGEFQKKINTYFIPSDKQRYNYDIYFERSQEAEIMVEVFFNEIMAGRGVLKFDANKTEMPNESIEILDGEKMVGTLECSLKKIQKKNKKPPLKIRIVKASFNQDEDTLGEMDPFVVIKYADNNHKTAVVQQGGKYPVWDEEFNIGTADNDRIFLQSWEEDVNGSQLIGVSTVNIQSKLGQGQQDIDITRDKVKKGTITIELIQYDSKRSDKSEKQINDKNFTNERKIKTYAVEAVMKQNLRKGGFIKMLIGDQEHETTPIFTSSKQLKWNQSFQIKCAPGEQLVAKLCVKDEIQEEIARCKININEIGNKKYELSLIDPEGTELGKLYLQFHDEQLDIKEDIHQNPSAKVIIEKQPTPPEIMQQQQKPVSKGVSSEVQEKLLRKNQQLKKRYANRQSIHDYMAQVNSVLQEGLLMVSKERPEDPIKHLGLFLINYKK